MTLAFALGIVATLLRSDLRIPEQVYTSLSIYLLLAIGLKGGHQLAGVALWTVALPAMATLALGVLVPLIAYPLARLLRFDAPNAGALAAHYGSVSAVTFATVLAFLDMRGEKYEGFMPALVAVLEVPAIVVGILLARRGPSGSTQWGPLLREVFTGKSIVLLGGGMLIGRFSTPETYERIAPVFVSLFYGALVLFMLDLGTVAATQLREVTRVGPRLIAFAIAMPLINGMLQLDWARGPAYRSPAPLCSPFWEQARPTSLHPPPCGLHYRKQTPVSTLPRPSPSRFLSTSVWAFLFSTRSPTWHAADSSATRCWLRVLRRAPRPRV